MFTEQDFFGWPIKLWYFFTTLLAITRLLGFEFTTLPYPTRNWKTTTLQGLVARLSPSCSPSSTASSQQGRPLALVYLHRLRKQWSSHPPGSWPSRSVKKRESFPQALMSRLAFSMAVLRPCTRYYFSVGYNDLLLLNSRLLNWGGAVTSWWQRLADSLTLLSEAMSPLAVSSFSSWTRQTGCWTRASCRTSGGLSASPACHTRS